MSAQDAVGVAAPRAPRRASKAAWRRPDPLITAGAVFFLMAVSAAAYPAIRAGPATMAGLALILGLAVVAFVGLYALMRRGPETDSPDLTAFAAALGDPCAILSSDGRVLAVNDGWRGAFGENKRLPREMEKALYPALSAARRGERARGRLTLDGKERPVSAAGREVAGKPFADLIEEAARTDAAARIAEGKSPV
ncbi:MAG: hypothetical protein ACXWVJ_04385, partial [Caulobacteraceae bacterium]